MTLYTIPVTLALSLALSVTPDVQAQWVQTPWHPGGDILCFAENGTDIYVGTFNDGVYLSTNNGTTWTAVSNGLTQTQVRALSVSDNCLFAGCSGGGVFRSTNNGVNWTLASTGLPGQAVYSLAAVGPNLFAGTWGGGVYRSADSGTTWLAANNGLSDHNINALAVVEENLFAGTYESGVFCSTNNGESWADAGLINTPVLSLLVDSTDIIAGTNDQGVFLSTNNGVSWATIRKGLAYHTSFDYYSSVLSLAASGKSIFAGTDTGLYLSTNDGTAWTRVDSGLPANFGVFAVAMIGSNVYLGTTSGVWRRPLSEMIGSSGVNPAPPPGRSITANPNPFSQSTTVTFSWPNDGFAQVNVVNLLGVEVARLFSGELEAGEHSFTWDAQTMPPGMYECIVRMNGSTAQAPIMLSR